MLVAERGPPAAPPRTPPRGTTLLAKGGGRPVRRPEPGPDLSLGGPRAPEADAEPAGGLADLQDGEIAQLLWWQEQDQAFAEPFDHPMPAGATGRGRQPG